MAKHKQRKLMKKKKKKKKKEGGGKKKKKKNLQMPTRINQISIVNIKRHLNAGVTYQ